jgi:hypothetical protein
MTEQRAKDKETLKGDLRVVVEVGNEHFEPGLTRLELLPDGQCIVINRFEGEEKRVKGHIDLQRAAKFLEQVTLGTIWKAKFGIGRGIPDEPRYRLEVYKGETLVHACHIWRSEWVVNRDIESLFKGFQDVVKEITDGRIIL